MAEFLRATSVAAPGFYGLNTEADATNLDVGWATVADNFVIDGSGTLACRKGWTQVTSTPITATPNVVQLFEYEKDHNTRHIISVANLKIYSGTTTLTERTNTITTPTGNNWKFVNFNGNVHGYQQGHTPIYWDGAAAGFVNATASSGSLPTGGDALAAAGRIWAFDSTNTVVKYSDLLLPLAWGTGGGSIDLKSVWAYGMDKGIALAMFNGNLVVFGEKSILIYAYPDSPTVSMSLVEHIEGTGCIARDSVQAVGKDLLFLSRDGVKSLGRTIQEKSGPITNISKNVKTRLNSYVNGETLTSIRSVYYEKDNLYILSLPTAGVDYCFNVSSSLEDGSARVTKWNSIGPHSWCISKDKTLYLGKEGVIAKYYGYLDDASSYMAQYKSPWMDLGTQEDPAASSRIKIPKRVSLIAKGSDQTVAVSVVFDYGVARESTNLRINSFTYPQYGIATYGVSTYSGSRLGAYAYLSAPLYGSGSILQLNLSTSINGSEFNIQRLDMRYLLGRIY